MAQRSTIYRRLWKRRAEEGDRNIEYNRLDGEKVMTSG